MVSEGRMTWDDMVSSRLLLRVSFEGPFRMLYNFSGNTTWYATIPNMVSLVSAIPDPPWSQFLLDNRQTKLGGSVGEVVAPFVHLVTSSTLTPERLLLRIRCTLFESPKSRYFHFHFHSWRESLLGSNVIPQYFILLEPIGVSGLGLAQAATRQLKRRDCQGACSEHQSNRRQKSWWSS